MTKTVNLLADKNSIASSIIGCLFEEDVIKKPIKSSVWKDLGWKIAIEANKLIENLEADKSGKIGSAKTYKENFLKEVEHEIKEKLEAIKTYTDLQEVSKEIAPLILRDFRKGALKNNLYVADEDGTVRRYNGESKVRRDFMNGFVNSLKDKIRWTLYDYEQAHWPKDPKDKNPYSDTSKEVLSSMLDDRWEQVVKMMDDNEVFVPIKLKDKEKKDFALRDTTSNKAIEELRNKLEKTEGKKLQLLELDQLLKEIDQINSVLFGHRNVGIGKGNTPGTSENPWKYDADYGYDPDREKIYGTAFTADDIADLQDKYGVTDGELQGHYTRSRYKTDPEDPEKARRMNQAYLRKVALGLKADGPGRLKKEQPSRTNSKLIDQESEQIGVTSESIAKSILRFINFI